MNLAFIRYFLAVAETGNFTEAAERCHVSHRPCRPASPVSRRRSAAACSTAAAAATLSAAGQRLLPHARAVVEAWRLARAEQRSSRRTRLVRIVLASTVPVSVGHAVARGGARPGRVRPRNLRRHGRGGGRPLAARPLRCRPLPGASGRDRGQRPASLWREPYVLAAASNHLVATRDRWSVKDLADTPFILRAACEAHDEATRLVAAEGVRPRAVLRSADEERCAAAVLAGLGVSLMPRSLLRPGMASAEIREVAWNGA